MKRFNFDRYRGNTLMAEGLAVHSETLADATKKAIALNGDDTELIAFRDNEPCIVGYCKICDANRQIK